VRHPVVSVALRRLVLAVPLLLVVSVLSFVIVSLTPGNVAQEILGTNAPPESYAQLRRELGLNLPLYEQYWHWFEHAIHGNMGESLFSGQPVTQLIGERLPVTLSLIGLSLLAILVIGVGLGVFSAVRGGVAGRLVDTVSLVGFALPSFWAGAVLIAIFAVILRWLPATGYAPLTQSPSQWTRSLVLPVVALSMNGVAAVAKQTREAMLDVLGSEYVRMARANGIPERSIVLRHALKNAAIRTVTILGIQAVGLLGGTVLVESVFALPGLGGLAVTAATEHDLPTVQGLVVYFTLIVVVVNLLIDLSYTWLSPRVRLQ
jgi:peptide/nickel transport system permease protein